jgi:hypothetical protein
MGHRSKMIRPNHVPAPKSATGNCRDRRRPQGRRWLAWLSIAASVPAAFIELTNVAVTNQKALVREERVPRPRSAT